ncbi:hypothetical protein [Haloarchaeobius sp. DFWS5]|uniref:hypothetical protein n=1 Tax=Haloarchaeobius sp. DFWS5 TaxID=3446114 RepID=UPI003EB8BE3A
MTGTTGAEYTFVVAAVSFAALLVSTATVWTLKNSPWSATGSRPWFLVGIAFCEVNAVLLTALAVVTLVTGREASGLMLLMAFGVFFAVVGGYQQTRNELLTAYDVEDV